MAFTHFLRKVFWRCFVSATYSNSIRLFISFLAVQVSPKGDLVILDYPFGIRFLEHRSQQIFTLAYLEQFSSKKKSKKSKRKAKLKQDKINFKIPENGLIVPRPIPNLFTMTKWVMTEICRFPKARLKR